MIATIVIAKTTVKPITTRHTNGIFRNVSLKPIFFNTTSPALARFNPFEARYIVDQLRLLWQSWRVYRAFGIAAQRVGTVCLTQPSPQTPLPQGEGLSRSVFLPFHLRGKGPGDEGY